jgi:hypothetical protein
LGEEERRFEDKRMKGRETSLARLFTVFVSRLHHNPSISPKGVIINANKLPKVFYPLFLQYKHTPSLFASNKIEKQF